MNERRAKAEADWAARDIRPSVPVDDLRARTAPTVASLRPDLVYRLPLNALSTLEGAVVQAGDDADRVAALLGQYASRVKVAVEFWDAEARNEWAVAEIRGDALLEPDFLHGVGDDMARMMRRRKAYRAAHGYGAGRPLAPCYSPSDLRVDWHGATLTEAGKARVPILLDNLADLHGEHWYYSAPFCRECYGERAAKVRLYRWLIVNGPSRTPAEEIPAEVPGDVVEVEEAERGSPFLSVSELLELEPAPMLVGEIVPASAYGLITGRDGTFKSFLALDIALSVAMSTHWYGQRPTGTEGYGRALYLVGEGLQSFGSRVSAWLSERGLTAADIHPGGLTVRNGTVNLFTGGVGYDDLLAQVQDTEPDLIVIDTLARSSGAAKQNDNGDMGIVIGRVDELRKASNGGTVLVVAHTTKADADTRGASCVEDNADFVLKVSRDGMTQKTTVHKMKDAEDGWSFSLTVVKRDGSLVLREPPQSSGPLLDEDASTRQHIEGALFATRGLDPLTRSEIGTRLRDRGKDVSRTSVDKALKALVNEGFVVEAGKRGASTVYRLADHRVPDWATS